MRRALIIVLLMLGSAPASAQPNRDASIRAYLQRVYSRDRADLHDARYALAWADLNGDGREEAFVRITGMYMCGTSGCGLSVFSRTRRGWREVADFSITQLPIRLLPGRSHGWRDIGVFVRGGGILPGYHARLSFNGRTYPYNPSVPPAQRLRAAGPGRVLISDATPTVPLFGPQRRPR